MKIEFKDKVEVTYLGGDYVWLDLNPGTDHSEVYAMSAKQARKLARKLVKAAALVDGRPS